MADFNRGEVIVAEAQLKEYTPFDTHALADPDSTPTITVTDNVGTVKVDAKDLTKSITGKYYYLIETASSWNPGNYVVQIVSVYNSKTNTHINDEAFVLQ